MANKSKPEIVEIPEEEYEDLKRANRENSEIIKEMIGKLDQMQAAQLSGIGIDPRISARGLLASRPVQFLRHYSKSARPSKIQKNAMVFEGYSVSSGDIVHLKTDEIKRIKGEWPDMIETDESKFVEKINYRAVQELDEHGRMRWKKVANPVPVKVLLSNAIEVG